MEAPQDVSKNQPKISSFAPELIDAILGHLHSTVNAEVSQVDAKSPSMRKLENYSLISQSWRGPVQRRMMRRLVIKSGSKARTVAEGLAATGLHVHVRDLGIRTSGLMFIRRSDNEPRINEINAADGVTASDVLALLAVFPHVASFELEPVFTQFRVREAFILYTSPFLLPLTHLRISMPRFQRSVAMIHDLLALTPNITTLSLQFGDRWDNLEPSSMNPIHLPDLTRLKIINHRQSTSFLNLALLSRETITQITDFGWKHENRGTLALCVLGDLTAKTRPPSLRTIILRAPFSPGYLYDTEEELNLILEDIKISCKEAGVELIGARCPQYSMYSRPLIAHPKIALFAPEVIDAILDHVVSSCKTRGVKVLEEIDLMRVLPPDLAPPPTTLKRIIIESDFGRPHYEEDTDDPETLSVREMRDESLIWDFEELVFACRRAAIELVVKGPQMRQMLKRMT
ncbi:hypothetical protein RQP46_006098 [Phenoliferia psychrophenolica]